jgi:hypothetical protein
MEWARRAAGIGTIVPDIDALPSDSFGLLQQGFGGDGSSEDYVGFFLWAGILLFAHVISIYPVLMIQRLRAEERSGRAELAQGTPMTRVRWAAGQLVVTTLGTAGLFTLAGLVLGFGYGPFTDELPGPLGRVPVAALSCVPAAWLIAAVSFLAYALTPRYAVPISWAVVVWTAILGKIAGPLYNVWGGTPLEPFHYLPNTLAGQPFSPSTILATLALTALLVYAGLTALRHRLRSTVVATAIISPAHGWNSRGACFLGVRQHGRRGISYELAMGSTGPIRTSRLASSGRDRHQPCSAHAARQAVPTPQRPAAASTQPSDLPRHPTPADHTA